MQLLLSLNRCRQHLFVFDTCQWRSEALKCKNEHSVAFKICQNVLPALAHDTHRPSSRLGGDTVLPPLALATITQHFSLAGHCPHTLVVNAPAYISAVLAYSLCRCGGGQLGLGLEIGRVRVSVKNRIRVTLVQH